jgi:tetratricopeptide (TPR) repeat protein
MSPLYSNIKYKLKYIMLLSFVVSQVIILCPTNASEQRDLRQPRPSHQNNSQLQQAALMKGSPAKATLSAPNLRPQMQQFPIKMPIRSQSQPQNLQAQQKGSLKKRPLDTSDNVPHPRLTTPNIIIPEPVQSQFQSETQPVLVQPKTQIVLSVLPFEEFAKKLRKSRKNKDNDPTNPEIALQKLYQNNFHYSFALAGVLRKNQENSTQTNEAQLENMEKRLLSSLSELKVSHERANSNKIYEEIVLRILLASGIEKNKLGNYIDTTNLKHNSLLLLMPDDDLHTYVMLMSEYFNDAHNDIQGLKNKFRIFLKEVKHRKLNILPSHLLPLLHNLKRVGSAQENRKLITALLRNLWSPSIFTYNALLEVEGKSTERLTLQDFGLIFEQYTFIDEEESAIEVIEQVINNIKPQQDSQNQLEIYKWAGGLYYNHEKYEEAEINYQKAIKIELQNPLSILTVRDYINLAHASYKLNKPEEEVKALIHKACEIFDEHGDRQQRDAFMLSRFFMKLGDVGSTLHYLGQSFSLKDSSKDKEDIIEETTYQAEIQEKLKEIMKISKGPILQIEKKQAKGQAPRKKRHLETTKGKEKDEEEHKSASPKKKQKTKDIKKSKEGDVKEFISVKSVSDKTQKKRLILGEADFSFTVALLKKHAEKYPNLKKNITATEFQPESSLKSVYPDTFPGNLKFLKEQEVKVEFGIDARKIHEHYKGCHFDRIHFNFPHDKSSFNARTLPKLIEKFFESASHLQNIDDRINIALPHLQSDDDNMFRQGYIYEIYPGSVGAGYKFLHKRTFDDKRYPGYKHRKTGEAVSVKGTESGREYIFTKRAITDEDKIIIRQEQPPREYKSSKGTLEALPLVGTQDESSAEY